MEHISATETRVERSSIGLWGRLRDFELLVKLRLTLTVLFSAVMAWAIATPVWEWKTFGLLVLGGFFVTAAANALNEALEKDYDKLMTRTAGRPMAAGRMSMSKGVLIAGLMSVTGFLLLGAINALAVFFGALALVSYAFVYTPMKRVSTAAIPIGAIPGAMPMLIGGVAATGELTALAVSLFALQFLWQFPHFWAIGWLGFEEYEKAGFKMVQSVDRQPDKRLGLQSAFYALCLALVAWVPHFIGAVGMWSALAVCLLSLGFAWVGWRLYEQQSRKAALALMFYSLLYLPLALVLFFIDKV